MLVLFILACAGLTLGGIMFVGCLHYKPRAATSGLILFLVAAVVATMAGVKLFV